MDDLRIAKKALTDKLELLIKTTKKWYKNSKHKMGVEEEEMKKDYQDFVDAMKDLELQQRELIRKYAEKLREAALNKIRQKI